MASPVRFDDRVELRAHQILVPTQQRDELVVHSLRDHDRSWSGVDLFHVAYVIYTSGSTGKPKGVRVTHANVMALMDAALPLFGFTSDDVWTLFHSTAFDFSVWEIWGALLTGGRVVVVPKEVAWSPESFMDPLRAERVDAALVLRSVFRRDGNTWLRAGAGIVAQFTPERELEEKLRSVSRFLVPALQFASAD